MLREKIIILGISVALSLSIVGCAQMLGGSLTEATMILPDDVTSLWYINPQVLDADNELEDIYDDFRNKIDEDGMEDAMGIYMSDLRTFVFAESNDAQWVILGGEINFDDIRFALEDQNLEEDEYRGIEIWYGNFVVAFIGNMVILSDDLDSIKTSIRLSKGKGNSMYDDEDIGAVVERLPSGFISHLTKGNMAGSQASGITINKLYTGKGSLEIRGWYKFEKDSKAEANIDNLEEQIEYEFDAISIDCYQHKNYIESIAEVDVSDFVESSSWRRINFR